MVIHSCRLPSKPVLVVKVCYCVSGLVAHVGVFRLMLWCS
jgi:hypothetical protein